MERSSKTSLTVADAAFVTEARALDRLPTPRLPEIAFAGRSNVGKSSALRTLLGQRSLVRVSRTPGQTRGLVFFEGRLLPANRAIALVDLPGYGYSKAPQSIRREWEPLIEGYLRDRATLRAVVCLVDLRRGVLPPDRELVEFLRDCGRPAIVVGTKLDRLPRARRAPALDEVAGELGMGCIGFSAHDRSGLAELLAALEAVTV